MKPLPIHPYCDLFPDIEGEEFGAFVKSIKENGLQVPIDEYGSQVIDGKNRQRACLLAGVTPIYKVWSPPKGTPKEGIDDAILAFVKSRNLDRRHFTPSQLGMMASKLANLRKGGDKGVHKSNPPIGGLVQKPITQKEAADTIGATERSTQRAAAVRENAKPAVVKAVEQGKMTLHAAEATIPKKPAKPKEEIPANLQAVFAWREKFRAYEKLHGPAIAELAIGFAHEVFDGGKGPLDHKKVASLLDEIHRLLMPWQPEKVCGCGGDEKCKKCDGRGWTRKG